MMSMPSPAAPNPAPPVLSDKHRRIAKNTILLYFRLILATAVSLYTIRVVLNVLGVEDYGINNVVAGVVALSAFLPGTMASATQRFFSFALGANDDQKIRKIFSVNCVLYLAIALLALLALETIGLWFVTKHLHVPPARYDAALLLYHVATLTFIIGIFTSPFNAIIVAHEDMHLYAYVSIFDALLKLLSVYLLAHLPGDKLEVYGLLLLVIGIINAATYIGICMWRYKKYQLFRRFEWDLALLREIMGFTGWTLFGQLTTVVRTHAVTVLLNQLFNPAVVAARAVATSVANQTNLFSHNFNVSLYSPIIKSYAAQNKSEMFSLVFNGSKLTFFLMWVFALPLFVEMEAVLRLWLINPPVEATLFTRLALLDALIFSISMPLTTAARAPGKMRFYELTLGIMQLAIFPASWAALKASGDPSSVFVVAIVVSLLMFFVRLVIVHRLTGLPLSGFGRKVIVPVLCVVCLSALAAFGVKWLLPQGLGYSAVSVVLNGALTGLCIYFVGLDKHWRHKIQAMAANKLSRKKASA
jgi:O-antigen/teichoic acid export membrane protein